MRVEVGGLLGFILLACVIYAIVKTVESDASTGIKVLWILALLVLPFLGFVLWLFLGPRRK